MTTDITELAQSLKAAADKATPGEWWSDVVETDGEYGEGEDRFSGYHSYAVYVGSESLLDMTNSTAACIHTEWDRDYLMAWDETARRNSEFIALANPANILALVEALEKAQAKNALVAGGIEATAKLHERIAELESRNVTVKLPEPEQWDITQVLLCKKKVVAAIRAAGIKVEAE